MAEFANTLKNRFALFYTQVTTKIPLEEECEEFKRNFTKATDENEISNTIPDESNAPNPVEVPDSYFIFMKTSYPSTSKLYNAIKEMSNYGKTLTKSNSPKGAIVESLAKELEDSLDLIVQKSLKEELSEEEVVSFKKDFKKLIENKESQLSEHREKWKPIVANILIALTGIGFLLLAAKAITQAYQAWQKKEPLSFNKAIFFGKTKSQNLAEEVKNDCDLIKNNVFKK